MNHRESILSLIDEKTPQMQALSKWLYEHPEIGLQEFESAKKLCETLRELGFTVEEHLAGMETAFRATKKNGDGPRVAFVAEYDALPGNGHACGHHMIATMSVTAAMALASLDLPGEVAVIGTPSEETGHGKPYLVEHGVFEGYDAALMIHPNNFTAVYADWIAIGGIDFHFKGVPAHAGSAPYLGVNALDAVVLFWNNISALRQQLKDGTRIHGIIVEAGSAANVIPDSGKVRMEFRAKEQAYFDVVVERAIHCAEAAALATGCTLEYEHYEPTCQGVNHNRVLTEQFKAYMEELGIQEDSRPMVGSTDMGNVSQLVPSIHPLLKVVDVDAAIHSPEFKVATMTPYAQEKMMVGAKILALTGLKVMEDKEFREKAMEELKGDR
ncbi:MAG: M20 family metallopeptidase [Oscillospiraceae bacterium]